MNDVRNVITNIVIVILGILLTVFTITFLSELLSYKPAYETKAKNMYSEIKYGSYYNLPEEVRQNRILNIRETAELKECYAVADYLVGASLYRAYSENNEIELAEKYETIMNDSQKDLGDLSYIAEEINQKLGIKEESTD